MAVQRVRVIARAAVLAVALVVLTAAPAGAQDGTGALGRVGGAVVGFARSAWERGEALAGQLLELARLAEAPSGLGLFVAGTAVLLLLVVSGLALLARPPAPQPRPPSAEAPSTAPPRSRPSRPRGPRAWPPARRPDDARTVPIAPPRAWPPARRPDDARTVPIAPDQVLAGLDLPPPGSPDAGREADGRPARLVRHAVSRSPAENVLRTGQSRPANGHVVDCAQPAPQRETATSPSADAAWSELAAQVEHRCGGDRAALEVAVERIVAARRQTVAELRAAGLTGRLTALALASLPVLVAVFLSLAHPGYLEQLTRTRLGWLELAVAAVLTAVGVLWLHRVSRPPFAALPRTWRAQEQRDAVEQQILDALDLALLYTVAGLPLGQALEQALPDEPHPARGVVELLSYLQTPGAADVENVVARPDMQPWEVALLRAWSEGMPAHDALEAGRTRLEAERLWRVDEQARGFALATAAPLAGSVLPASVVLGLAALT